MKYITIDFETANEDYASICQVGLAIVEGYSISTWGTYVNPEDDFSPMNISIHGITSDMVKNRPTFPQIYDKLLEYLRGNKIFCYGGFDIAAFRQVRKKYGLRSDDIEFFNVHKMVRRHWEQFSKCGFGLENVCNYLNISNEEHHDAVNDAIVCHKIISNILSESGKSLEWWVDRIKSSRGNIAQDGNPDGELFGETISFTGKLKMLRGEAAKIAAHEGANVVDSFSRKITILVVGNLDLKKVKGDVSGKHKKTLEYNEKGGRIKIIKEDDFLALVNL